MIHGFDICNGVQGVLDMKSRSIVHSIGIVLALGLLVGRGEIAMAAGPSPKDCAKAPKVKVNYTRTNVKYQHNLSSKQLAEISDDKTTTAGFHLAGLYKPAAKVEYKYSYIRIFKPNNKLVCLYPSEVVINYHVDRVIYFSTRYKRGSCMYNVINRHEQNHLKFDDDVTRRHTTNWRQTLPRQLTRSNGYESEQQLADQIASLVDGYLKAMQTDARKMHATIDNEKNYRKESRLCPKNARK